MIADFENYLRDTNRRFADQYISIDQDWLTGCVEWFLSENPQISNENLYKNAYEQWLLSDLVESGIKCLPQTIQNNKNEFEFTGNYALQMQYLIDIAESAYEQYRNIHDKKLDEAEEGEAEHTQRNVSKKKRTLKLELTDGHNTVTAMEHCPISCLSTKLYPGTKILVKGPMRCVNKVLFLQPANVKVLGGEVERLSIEYAYENVLLKAMGRPVTSTPKLDYKGQCINKTNKILGFKFPRFIETAAVEQNKMVSNIPPMPVVSHNPQTPRNIIHDDDDDLFANLDIDYLNKNVAAVNHSTHVNQRADVNQFLDDDDDIFFEANIPDTTVTETASNNARPNYNDFDDDDDFDPTEIEANIEMEIQNEERRDLIDNRVEEFGAKPVAKSIESAEYFDPDLNSMFSNTIEDDFGKVSNDITDRNYEFKIAGCPLATILQLHSIDDNDKSERSFVVKCEVFKTVGRIQIVSNRYQLVVLIQDLTGMQLEVQVSNDVVAELAEVTAEELQKMRSTLNQRPQQKQEIENILKKLSDTITEFHGFMRIEYSHKNEMPVVTEVLESRAEFDEILRRKLVKGV